MIGLLFLISMNIYLLMTQRQLLTIYIIKDFNIVNLLFLIGIFMMIMIQKNMIIELYQKDLKELNIKVQEPNRLLEEISKI